MNGATTIVIARDDLSIAGAPQAAGGAEKTSDGGRALFEVIHNRSPEIIVIDCRGPGRGGVAAVERIRAKTGIPILVICEADDSLQQQYRIVGATDCLLVPFDILGFNERIQEIVRLTTRPGPRNVGTLRNYQFSGINFDARKSAVYSTLGSAKLTTAESQLLTHFIRRQGVVCTRAEISEVLYGPYRPVSDRAIDVVVARLRRKLTQAQGANAEALVKTEFRQGYLFTADLMPAEHAEQNGVGA